ncbi:type VII secretion-associated serine protease mycosin [Streptomyces sp. NPDC001046]|uniref:type VII secretion-associated serine protease mycosin n=1 Tax=unclassified Streptomyces TaxID=2593676 RepID=UPI003686D8C1
MYSRNRARRPFSAASAALGLLLVGVAATPAHAESVRDRQWHLDAMHADEMWQVSTGRGITVAVIDSGVDDTVADLTGQVLAGKDFSDQQGDEHTDIDNHGTGMAALIAATGERGYLHGSHGLAPGSKILPVRMRYSTEDYGQVDSRAQYAHVLSEAIRYTAHSEARIINISMGVANTPGRQNAGTPELASAVRYAIAKGKLIFAAVGNTGDKDNSMLFPAATPGVVGVAATDKNGRSLQQSQKGPQVDLAAPGDGIINACTGGTQLCTGSGTSAASALASASAALIWAQHPDWTNHQVLRVLLNTAGKPKSGANRTDSIGYGIVRPRIALKTPGNLGPADEYPMADLAAAASQGPPNEASPSAGLGGDRTAIVKPKPTSTASVEGDGVDSSWLALGMAAAALLTAAVTIPTLRARRRRSASVRVDPAPPPLTPPYQSHTYSPSLGHGSSSSPASGSEQSQRP